MAMEMNREERGEERGNCTDGSSSLVKWERFLPRMVVRVLLVEADDSTRQIISALLRKCNYKVAAVRDGLNAWEVLKAKPGKIDLILTEMELSSISGFALLTLITEDELCKNIPVIMMSSHDSVGTVYKCMMRGATDFLMKPIRINELKNLWQHVWRRQSTTIVPGLGGREEQEKEEATDENDAASEPSKRDAQSSCGNPDLEAKSANAQEESEDLSGSRVIKSHPQDTEKATTHAESSKEAIDLIGTLDINKGNSHGLHSIIGSKLFEPELNLSLRRSQVGGFEINTKQNNVLIHSNASAFSRYSNKPLQIEITNGKEAKIALPSQEHAPHSLHHHSADRATLCERDFNGVDQYRTEEQKGENLEEKTCFSTADDQSWTESLGASAGDMNPSVPLRAESENGNVDGRFAHSGRNSQRSVQREAALAKFRLKRKDRCYDKKVRYESRKKLAEQRPRVKGQFVCRIPPDPPPLANRKAA